MPWNSCPTVLPSTPFPNLDELRFLLKGICSGLAKGKINWFALEGLKLGEDECFVVQFNPLIVELKWEKKGGDITRICFNREARGPSLGCLCYHDDSMLHYLPISSAYRFSTHLLPLNPIGQFLTICILNRHENIPKKRVLDAIAVHDKNSCSRYAFCHL